jgi:hypothetical protein
MLIVRDPARSVLNVRKAPEARIIGICGQHQLNVDTN